MLQLLRAASDPIAIEQLAEDAGVDFLDLADTLETLEASGAVVVEGQPGTEFVRLT